MAGFFPAFFLGIAFLLAFFIGLRALGFLDVLLTSCRATAEVDPGVSQDYRCTDVDHMLHQGGPAAARRADYFVAVLGSDSAALD